MCLESLRQADGACETSWCDTDARARGHRCSIMRPGDMSCADATPPCRAYLVVLGQIRSQREFRVPPVVATWARQYGSRAGRRLDRGRRRAAGTGGRAPSRPKVGRSGDRGGGGAGSAQGNHSGPGSFPDPDWAAAQRGRADPSRPRAGRPRPGAHCDTIPDNLSGAGVWRVAFLSQADGVFGLDQQIYSTLVAPARAQRSGARFDGCDGDVRSGGARTQRRLRQSELSSPQRDCWNDPPHTSM
jgi:hypothetical protein